LQHLNLQNGFSIVVTGEDVSRAKPAPDIFLLAAQKLGVSPSESVVVEDSVAGVQAAIAGGMKCVGFTCPEHAAELYNAGADDVVADFSGESLRYFQEIAANIGNASQRSLISKQGR